MKYTSGVIFQNKQYTSINRSMLQIRNMAPRKIPIYMILLVMLFFGSSLQATIAQSSGILPIQDSSPSSSLTALSNKSSTANVSSNVVNSTSTTMPPTVVKIGALLPLTGALASGGHTEKAALDIAIKQINENLSNTNSKIRVSLVAEDTHTDPLVSLEKLKDLVAQGVSMVIGPVTSAELSTAKNYADTNGILLISPGSTSVSLAIPGDHIFRFMPDDRTEAQALANKMWQDGIRVIVPMWRNDTFGNELSKYVISDFEKLGGTVSAAIKYDPTATFPVPSNDNITSKYTNNNSIWRYVNNLSSETTKATALNGTNKVGIFLIAFDEVVPIFNQARDHPVLSTVKWYGTGGTAQNEALVRNSSASFFAIKTGFLNPLLVNEPNEKLTLLSSQIKNAIGNISISSYSYPAYDALWVAALTENATRGLTSNVDALKRTFTQIADSYIGATGNTSLNAAGDRKYAHYDFWIVKQDAPPNTNSFHWEIAPTIS
jgi:branched-chain amino acid transport system substrate-binding protein